MNDTPEQVIEQQMEQMRERDFECITCGTPLDEDEQYCEDCAGDVWLEIDADAAWKERDE